MDMLSKKIGIYQCASIPFRGQTYGKKALERWFSEDAENCRYAIKMDIKQCYPSINKDKLMALLRRDVKNDRLLWLIEKLLSTFDQGLSIGSYLSQWLCNYYLSYAYHYASEQLFKIRRSKNGNKRIRLISHVLFYMDDFTIIGSSIKDLRRVKLMIIKYMKNILGLTVKENISEIRIHYIDKDNNHHGTFLDMMGYRVYRNFTTIRRSLFKKVRRAFMRGYKYIRKKRTIPLQLCRRIISYFGYVKNTNTNWFKKKYAVNKVLDVAKKFVSKYRKKVVKK